MGIAITVPGPKKKKGIHVETRKYEPRPPPRRTIHTETVKYSPPEEYTPAQATAISQFQTARERYFTGLRRRRYDPDKTYYEVQRRDAEGRPVTWRHVSGADVIRDIDKGYSEHWKSQRTLQRAVGGIPFGYTLKEGKDGYTVQRASIPFLESHKGKLISTFGETPAMKHYLPILSKILHKTPEQLMWGGTRYTYEEQKQRMFEGMPPVHKQMVAFNQAAASFAASPVTIPILLGAKITHLTTGKMIDIPDFRPSGATSGALGATFDMLPFIGSGTTKEWERFMKDPLSGIAATGGDIMGLIAVSPVYKQVFRPIKYAGGKSFKYGFKHTPDVFSKFTKSFPNEKFVTNTLRRLGSSDVISHAYKWGAKSWKPGLRLSPGTHTPIRETKGILESVFKKVPYKHGERVWMSPSQYSFAQKELARLLGTGGKLNINFPTVRTVEGGQRVFGTMRYEKYVLKGIFKPKLYRIGYFAEYSNPIFQASRMYWKGSKSIFGGFSRKIGQRVWVDDFALTVKKGSGGIPTKGRIPIDFPVTETLKDGTKIITGGKGFKDVFLKEGIYASSFGDTSIKTLIGLAKPLPKKWIQKLSTRRIPGLLSVGELGKTEIVYKPISSIFKSSGRGMIPGGITIPSGAFTSSVTDLSYGILGGFKYDVDRGLIHKPKRITLQASASKRKTAYLTASLSDVSLKTNIAQISESASIQKMLQDTMQLTDFQQKQKYITVGKTSRQRYDYLPNITIPKFPFFIPPMSLGGRGRMFYDDAYYRKKYKFRKWDVPDLSKMIRGMGF